MLRKYFTKSRHQSAQDIEKSDVGRHNGEYGEQDDEKRKRHSIHNTSDLNIEEFHGSSETVHSWHGTKHYDEIFQYQSHLSMDLTSIIADPICLSYFVQYLEDRKVLSLVKFYLDTENFKKVALAQQNQAELTVKKANEAQIAQKKTADKKERQKSNKNHNVPESISLYDLSMHKPLTDDEKSQLYADEQLSKQKIKNEATENYISATSVADAIIIYQKYLSFNAKHFINIPIDILSQISLLICKNDNDGDADGEAKQQISLNCFDEAQKWVLQQLESRHLNDFLQSKYYYKYCVELIENCANYQLNICDILYSETTLFYFMEFLEQHGERNCLDFWTQAINYRKSFNTNTQVSADCAKDAQADAMIIYDKYFSLQAECRLWLSDKVRHHVEQLICDEHIELCYDLPLRLIVQYLEDKYLHLFLESLIFTNYVQELKDKLVEFNISNSGVLSHLIQEGANFEQQEEEQREKRGHRKTRSVGDNIGHKNTLLAMDTIHLRNANMNIDARQLTEPQLLWHRRHANKLTFGTVNALGRFERDFENNLDITSLANNWSLAASGNKIKNVMRKFVKFPEEDQMQEEIAWQVAEMIVKDVTSITLQK